MDRGIPKSLVSEDPYETALNVYGHNIKIPLSEYIKHCNPYMRYKNDKGTRFLWSRGEIQKELIYLWPSGRIFKDHGNLFIFTYRKQFLSTAIKVDESSQEFSQLYSQTTDKSRTIEEKRREISKETTLESSKSEGAVTILSGDKEKEEEDVASQLFEIDSEAIGAEVEKLPDLSTHSVDDLIEENISIKITVEIEHEQVLEPEEQIEPEVVAGPEVEESLEKAQILPDKVEEAETEAHPEETPEKTEE